VCKIFCILILVGSISGLTSTVAFTHAQAQEKDKDKEKKVEQKDVKKSEESGIVEVYMAKDGWRFRIKNAEGKSIAIGTVGFANKEDALRAIEMVKTTLNKGKLVETPDPKK